MTDRGCAACVSNENEGYLDLPLRTYDGCQESALARINTHAERRFA